MLDIHFLLLWNGPTDAEAILLPMQVDTVSLFDNLARSQAGTRLGRSLNGVVQDSMCAGM